MKLIEKGDAYVDSLTEERDPRVPRRLLQEGQAEPVPRSPVAENLDLFRRMRAGEFPEGAHVLRAKIDLESQNMNMRDPLLYRIRYAPHHRTGNKWCIYPMYDYAHPLSDAIEKITHSICTLEFESHRPLYDWCIREAEVFPSQQIEFARLQPDLHGDVEAQARRAGAEEASSPAGTIRACRRWPACAGAATRPRRSAPSASASAWPRPTASSTSGCSSTRCARISTGAARA